MDETRKGPTLYLKGEMHAGDKGIEALLGRSYTYPFKGSCRRSRGRRFSQLTPGSPKAPSLLIVTRGLEFSIGSKKAET